MRPIARSVALLLAPLAMFGAEPLRLTLRDAVATALKQNPQVVIANLGIAESQEQKNIARSSLLPQVAFQASEKVTRGNIETSLGTRIPGFPQHVGPFWTSTAGVGFDAAVFDLTLWRRYQATRQGIAAARAGEVTIREQAVLLVVSQYLGCQRAAAEVKASESRVELAQALFQQAEDLLNAGAGTGIDRLRANVQMQNEKQRLIIARTQFETALYGLARLLNIDPQRPIEIADTVSFFETPAYDAQQSLERAWTARPELRAIAAQQAAQKLARQAASDARLPSVHASGGYTQQGLTWGSVIPVYQYGIAVNIPLFTGGRIGAEQARADIELRKLQQQETELRNRIALEVKTSLKQVEAARGEVEVASLAVKLANEEVEQARDRFRAGVANNIEVITAQDELARANDNQIAALYRYNQARADLAHASGQMESLYSR